MNSLSSPTKTEVRIVPSLHCPDNHGARSETEFNIRLDTGYPNNYPAIARPNTGYPNNRPAIAWPNTGYPDSQNTEFAIRIYTGYKKARISSPSLP